MEVPVVVDRCWFAAAAACLSFPWDGLIQMYGWWLDSPDTVMLADPAGRRFLVWQQRIIGEAGFSSNKLSFLLPEPKNAATAAVWEVFTHAITSRRGYFLSVRSPSTRISRR